MEEGKRKGLNQNKQADQRGLIVDEKRRTLLKGAIGFGMVLSASPLAVHLSAEKTKKYTISKSTAIGAVSSIFTIANDF